MLAFALGLYGASASAWAGWRGGAAVAASGRNALVAAFGAALVAGAALLEALASHDFSVQAVADTTSRELPSPYTYTAFWASQPGSLLLWLTVLTGATSVCLVLGRNRDRDLMPWVAAVLGGVVTFFAAMVAFVSNPFERVAGAAPANGNGLDPALQNPYMAIHPPTLYLGYVLFAVPFAFAMASLLARRADARWIAASRRFTLVSWTALGVGMLLGAHWAYVEIGWGGYWAWDPVENAALMPWLLATAFLHSVVVQEKRGMLKVWNVCLVTGAFALCLFGTFLTRSSVVNSIHSFVQSAVGPWLLGFIALVLASATALLLVRLPLLRGEHRLESALSREASFLFNNLLLLALAFAVLWGVIFPVLSEAVRGVRSSVSTPYYEFFLACFGLPLLLLVGVGPAIAWRRASPTGLLRQFSWPAASALAVGALLVLLGLADSIPATVALSLCAFVTVTIGLEFARGTAARRSGAGEAWPRALATLIGRNRRRYGGYVVHLAVVLLVVGAVSSTVYSTTREAVLGRGDQVTVGGYTLTYAGLVETRESNSVTTAARLDVSRGGEHVGALEPARRLYPLEQRVTNEVGIRSSRATGEDLYTVLEAVDGDRVRLRVVVNPMVNLIWLAGAVFLLGATIAIWPDRRHARVAARRAAAALVRGT